MSQLEIIKSVMTESIKHRFDKIQERPRVMTPWGFSVDGRRSDKDNFKELYIYLTEHGHTHTYIRDADDQTIEVSVEQVEEIYKSIIQFSFDLYQMKWKVLQDIQQATTIDDIYALNMELIPPDEEY